MTGQIRSLLSLLTALFLFIGLVPLPVFADSSDPIGSETNPIMIMTLEQLNNVRNDLGAHYKLGNDIDASATENWNDGKGWEPIGTESQRFTGTFDGGGHKISRLYINRPSDIYVGLFGSVGNGGAVRNVGLEGGSVRGNDFTGGLVGYNVAGTVEKSYSTVSVDGNGKVGGLVGQNDISGMVNHSYATGNVTGRDAVGGLVGRNDNGSTVSQSYATGSVNGQYEVGGLVGRHYGSIDYSYAVGPVTGDMDVGGLVGRTFGTAITTSFYNSETTGQSGSGTSKTTAEMQTKSTFTNAGWDFDQVWGMNSLINSGYPVLVPPYIVTYDENGATGGTAPTAGRTYNQGESVTVYGNTGNLERESYTFAGWSFTSDGSGTSYEEDDNFTMGSSNVTMFAKWTPNGTIDPTTGSFDKYAPADVTTTLAIYGNALISISNGAAILNENIDYTVAGNMVTIKKEYLATQSVGETELTFTFSAVPAQTLKITVTDTTPQPTAPPAPTGLQATAWEGEVYLTWESIEGAESYRVYMYEGADVPADSGEWLFVKEHDRTEPADLVDNLTAGKRYWFTATAVSKGKESSFSQPVSAVPFTIITEVEPPNAIEVGKGIALEELKNRFPKKVQVHVRNLPSLDVNVDWDLEHTDYDPDQAGTYKVIGQWQLPEYVRNPQSMKVELSVIVLANTNARLSGIYLDEEPMQGFHPNIFTYTLEVPNVTERVTVTAATYDATTVYEVVGGNVQLLKVGNNPIKILVTAEDQKEQTIYTINVDRKPDTGAPRWPGGSVLTVSGITQTSVKLSWPGATDDVGVVGYRIYVDGKEPTTVRGDVYATTVNGLTADTNYTFKVTAYDAAGNESTPLSKQATTARSSSGGRGSEGGRALSGNADLEQLRVWDKDKELELTPSFAAGTTRYTARTEAEQVVIAVKPAHSAAKVTLEDNVITDRTKVHLEEGDNNLVLIVQAENGSKKEYMLTIRGEAPKPSESEPPKPSEPVIHFTDIAGHWAESYIKRAAAKGIISGYPDGTFQPNHPVTRAEFTVMLAGALQLEWKGATLSFTDNDQIGTWAQQAVAQAVQAGIVDGYKDRSFRPNAQITRAEMAVMFARALKLSLKTNTVTGFADDEVVPQWAKGSVEAIRGIGIVSGREGNKFVPNNAATRAEAAVMLLRMLDYKQE